MKKKHVIWIVVGIVVFIFLAIGCVAVAFVACGTMDSQEEQVLTGDYIFDPPAEDYIAVVRIEGTIQEQTEPGMLDVPAGYQHITTMDYIDSLIQDENNKGMLLYVDSPGGTVYESEEMYQKIKEYKETTKRPIWEYMAHYAASGGYMVSMNSDKIYANPNTVTGSIGVIMAGYDLTGLYEKLGIRYVSITTGPNKDSSQMTEEQIAIYQSQIEECYDSFVNIVAEGRNMSEKDVKKLADGRTYTAKQAKENGLIDEISSFEDMKNSMSEELEIYTFSEIKAPKKPFAELFAKAEKLVPKSEAQILTETAEEKESRVPMYFAEGLD